ncbi:uncharacterized protein [Drosophila virilis]|uniref:DUF19 domain-containing protein n=1 Tax=Drosophila virilis TaxID=7244 RepID=B4M8T2_DROVI|nr:uncharacterized protein LOC6634168 [Drosophila virilis]EDW57608.2 uncharacterized protein Dvir_GJ18053 [Drosophila virilis]
MSTTWRLLPQLLLPLLLILFQLQTTEAIWFPWYFHRYGFEAHSHGATTKVLPSGKAEKTTPISKSSNAGSATCPPGYQLKERTPATCPPGYQLKSKSAACPSESRLCDDNPLVMQLARLYVVSPERIVLLLAQPMLMEACEEISDVVDHIRSATSNCFISDDNIYGKLADGLKYYKEEVCDGGADSSSSNKKRCASLNEAHSCLKELRTDMIECEAPADWYEQRNATKVCQTFNDVLDCYYTRGAMLCGLEAARHLRSFAGDSMKRSMIHACDVNRRLPRVMDPMPVITAASTNSLNVLLASSFVSLHIIDIFI